MAGIPSRDSLRYRKKWVQQLPQRYPKLRKYIITFVLIVLFGIVSVSPELYWSEAPITYHIVRAAIALVVGAIITSDYDLLAKAGFNRLYNCINYTEDGLGDIIRRSYHAKRYIESGDEPISLTYWKNGKFRAEVDESAMLTEGIHFLVEVRVPSPGSSFRSPLTLCSAKLERLDQTNLDGKQLARLRAVDWFGPGDAVDEHEAIQYREKIPKLLDNDKTISPYITIEESNEIKQLNLCEWRDLYENISKVSEDLSGN